MKKTLLALLGILVLSTPLVAKADQYGDFTYTTNGGAVSITGYLGSDANVAIPSAINSLPVTGIGDFAFANNTSLITVVIPVSVASIGNSPFAACHGLITIAVDAANASYSSVDGVVFDKNQNKIILFPNGRTGGYVIPSSVTNIGNYAFYASLSLPSVTIPNSVTSIGRYAFDACWSLTKVTIPNSVTSISDNAFNSCISLTNITLSSSVTNIGGAAFAACYSLTGITIPASVVSIEYFAFLDCTSLRAIYFSGNAPSVGFDIFNGDDNLTVYYLAGAMGWGPTFAGRPTALWIQVLPNALTGTRVTTNGLFVFNLNGPVGSNYVIQVSSDLFNWVNLVTNVIPAGGMRVFDFPIQAGQFKKFYRALPLTQGPLVLQPGPVDSQDIWTTSVFYSGDCAGPGTGGGLNDSRLRVGGWGDEYDSLIQFNLAGLPTNATSAVLYLYCYNLSGGGTPLNFDRVTSSWDWRNAGTGCDRLRLWWADKPSFVPLLGGLTTPTQGQWYSVDITTLYNAWQSGTYPNYGVQFRPVYNGDNNFDEFYSADYIDDPTLRPKLVITPAN